MFKFKINYFTSQFATNHISEAVQPQHMKKGFIYHKTKKLEISVKWIKMVIRKLAMWNCFSALIYKYR